MFTQFPIAGLDRDLVAKLLDELIGAEGGMPRNSISRAIGRIASISTDCLGVKMR